MNPETLALGFQLVDGALNMFPALVADYEAAKAAGSASVEDLASLKVKIDAIDILRQQSRTAADAALDAAAKT